MATDSVMGLFADPQQIQQAQQQAAMNRGIELARLDPFQRASAQMYSGGYNLGGAIGGALGGQDPQLQMATIRKQLAQGKDLTSSAGWAAYAQELQAQGDLQGAAQAAQKSTEIQSGAEFKQAKLEQTSALAKDRDAAAMERLQERLAAEERMNMNTNETRRMITQLAASMRGSQPRALPASLQKEEGKDLEVIDTYTGQVQALTPALDALTPDAKGVRKLELGPLKNVKYEAQLLAGNSTPESRAYEGLKSAVDTAVNLQVSAEKGVQTDKDVLRFAKALIASYGRNDTEATYQALKRYQESIINAQERAKGRVESRRRSQGVDPYYVGETAQQPTKRIKLD